MSSDTQLTDNQRRWLSTFLAQFGEAAVGQKFKVVQHGNRRYARLGNEDIAINLTDDELVSLSRAGYVQVYASPAAIIFMPRVLEIAPSQVEAPAVEPVQGGLEPGRARVLALDIFQVYAWLGACLVVGLFSVYLLWLTIQQVLAQNLSASIASGLFTLISTFLTNVFFRNYDKANEHLKYLRSLG
jgi:hypothetical protein